MRNKLSWLGGVVTLLYLVFIAFLVSGRISSIWELPLNELGDFLAGVFGPVAFFWLILGFLQQGQELRQGTEALLLQAKELKNSVEQQSIMAAAATMQIEAQQKALQLQIDERDRELQPEFEFVGGTRTGGQGGSVRTSVRMMNNGNEVREVKVSMDPPIGELEGVSIGTMRRGSSSDFQMMFQCPEALVLGHWEVEYLRLDGIRRKDVFLYRIDPSSPFVILERPIAGSCL